MASSKSDKRGSRKEGSELADCVRKSVTTYLDDLNGEDVTHIYQMVVSEIEKPLLEVVMRYAADNQSKASRMLGINRNTLRKKLEQHDLAD